MNLEVAGDTQAGSKLGAAWRCKQMWLDFAEVFDTLRIVPRAILFIYGYWMIRVVDWTLHWYFAIPPLERTTQVTAVITVIIPGIFGLAVWVFKIYTAGGRDWDAKDPTADDK